MQVSLNTEEFCKFRIFAEIFPESWKRRERATWLSPWPLTSRATFPESTQDCDHSNLSSVQLWNCYENSNKMKTKLVQFNLQCCSGISRKELTQVVPQIGTGSVAPVWSFLSFGILWQNFLPTRSPLHCCHHYCQQAENQRLIELTYETWSTMKFVFHISPEPPPPPLPCFVPFLCHGNLFPIYRPNFM